MNKKKKKNWDKYKYFYWDPWSPFFYHFVDRLKTYAYERSDSN